MVHRRRAKQFRKSLKHTTSLSEQNENIVGLVFDYMQNVKLPKIPVQEVFYLRQLTLPVCCIYNTKTNQSHVNLYHEGQSKKGSNDVTSFIIKSDMKEMIPKEVNELHFFSDNCWGVKTKIVYYVKSVLLCVTPVGQNLSSNSFHWEDTPTIFWDRSFSTIKRPIKNKIGFLLIRKCAVTSWKLVVNSSKKSPCTVTLVETKMMIDYSSWWPTIYKKTVVSNETKNLPRQEKQSLVISKFYYFEYSRLEKGVLKASMYIRSGAFIGLHTFDLRKAQCLL